MSAQQQSEALCLAAALEHGNYLTSSDMASAAAELRRLDALNDELAKALRQIIAIHDESAFFDGKYGKELDAAICDQQAKINIRLGIARAVVAKSACK